MGVDCKLLVPWCLAWRHWDGLAYIGSILEMPRCYEAWDAINALPSRPLPGQLWEGQLNYDDENDTYHEHPVTTDRYGATLKIIAAGSLAHVLKPFAADANAHAMRAVVAFLESMPPNAPIVPYWH